MERASNLPLILILVALLVWFGFQSFQLLSERSNLVSLQTSLEGALQESQKMRAQLETLVSKTAELAQQGNPSAKKVIEELEKRGIPISASAPK